MKFVLYGMPCAGKTTLLSALGDKLRVVSGSSWLNEYCGGNFSALPDDAKSKIRVKYTEYLSGIAEGHIISDGHYAFGDTVVFTEADGDIYDVFLYLYCDPKEILIRMQSSGKNQKFSDCTADIIAEWQNREIEQLRSECHKRNKDFYVVQSGKITATEFSGFIDAVISGFSSYQMAVKLVGKIREWYPLPCELSIVDGDKTFITQDSFRLCSQGFTTTVFDGDFYTGYQAYCFEKETSSLPLQYDKLQDCTVNGQVWEKINNGRFIVLSAGIARLWERLAAQLGIPYLLASPLISADTKYYVVKLLRLSGYRVKAYGDSKNDLYMLKEADEGYLCLGRRISRSLSNADTSRLFLLYGTTLYILDAEKDKAASQAIDICRSSSGINGPRLAKAHFGLGYRLGCRVRQALPNKNAAVIILERGGRFFGDGFYMGFGGGRLYPYNPKNEPLPDVGSGLAIIVDSVINTGKTILELTANLRKVNPKIQICIVSNVIQREALSKFSEYALFAVRVSDNKFVGKRQKKQVGNTGPDTADRLFNLLDG